jgi:ADP-ribose pyrophosphatase YjhB (NUDIX family)
VTAPARDTFCSYCGTRYDEPLTYPRTCTACKTQVWANPIPVCVALVPVEHSLGTGLLVIRRAITPGIGKLALVGGFLEEHESWQTGCAREVREETGIEIEPSGLVPLYYTSSAPRPNRVLLFALARELKASELSPFSPDSETSERGLVFGFGGLDDVFAFSLHAEAARRYFAERAIERPHGFTPI